MPELTPTPAQTVGPFYGYALPYPGDAELVPPGSPGAIRLQGTVYDGAGEPVPDALLEIRQADTAGSLVQAEGSLHRRGPFTGWGRCSTNAVGQFTFTTVEPGSVGGAAPFFSVLLMARGLLDGLFTRAYLPVEESVLAADPLLSTLDSHAIRASPTCTRGRSALIAQRTPSGDLQFDIYLQGQTETPFLSFPRHR